MDNDLISRQATLDAICKAESKQISKDFAYCEDVVSRKAAIDALYNVDEYNGRSVEAIRNLPSAQPERTCVNCGRTVNNGGWYADGRTRCPIEEHYALPKDGFCHLWEERNVTDEDYPERRTDDSISD